MGGHPPRPRPAAQFLREVTMRRTISWPLLLVLAAVSLGEMTTACAASEADLTPAATATRWAVAETPPAPAAVATRLPAAEAAPPEEILQPYPYTTPLPPPTPTILDGVYQRVVPDRGTTVPCRRCAPYKAEGGTWTLSLEAGAFRVSHPVTRFQGVGSFTVTGERITFFNDPNCHRDVGVYHWELDGRSLRLAEVADPCAFGLRAGNLTAGRWLLVEAQGRPIDSCQPPNVEAAVTGHWPAPPECNPAGADPDR